jgi:flagellar motility protein MotE (MotC chaperone)
LFATVGLCVTTQVACRSSKSDAARRKNADEGDVPTNAQVSDEEAPQIPGAEPKIDEEPVAEHVPNVFEEENLDGDQAAPEVTAAELEVLTRLREQAGKLAQNKLDIAKREVELKRIESELQVRLDRINELENRLQRELGIGKAAEDRRYERVNEVAELIMTMPPQSGAEILSQMPNSDAEAIVLAISRKNGRKAAKVLAQMPPDRAAHLSAVYLEKDPNLPGTDDLVPKAPATLNDSKPDAAPPAGSGASATPTTPPAAADPAPAESPK